MLSGCHTRYGISGLLYLGHTGGLLACTAYAHAINDGTTQCQNGTKDNNNLYGHKAAVFNGLDVTAVANWYEFLLICIPMTTVSNLDTFLLHNCTNKTPDSPSKEGNDSLTNTHDDPQDADHQVKDQQCFISFNP